MSLSKYESTRGTTHLARIARAILGPCIDVLREVLSKEISPPDLEKKVKTYILQNGKPSISEQQKRLVYGKNYSVFDITLLYFLLRNMCSIPPHRNKWGKDPEPTDLSVSANIERIRILRNEWYGHATAFFLTDLDFERKWNHISQILKELEGYLGTATKYQDTLVKLKICCMDPDSIQHYIDTLLTVEELQTDVSNLKEDVEEIKKSIKISSTKGKAI
uniref:DZIP3-like HEPN domain-containing protein n=1 Tax=Magallana gigas TaxID=29159 RepID=A0A8W8LDC3_MAGGI